LVFLDSQEAISDDFYQNSLMHGESLLSNDEWLKSSSFDDTRRFESLKIALANKIVMDFGCGAGGFLALAKQVAHRTVGVELDPIAKNYWRDRLEIVTDIHDAGTSFDFITAFHVFEHLKDPRQTLLSLSEVLNPGGKIIIEVPNSEDALLTLYDCDSFQKFTYWSQHLYLFNSSNLSRLAKQVGLKVTSVQHVQRYTLGNHLHWLSKNKPGGHAIWPFFGCDQLNQAYTKALASIGKTDTLIAYLELSD
jgi:cyclopropane fatty-acyl-phospholipid synthase-like methyltransferase